MKRQCYCGGTLQDSPAGPYCPTCDVRLDNITKELAEERKKVKELTKDLERLDWLEKQARSSLTGISFDYVPSCDGEPSGWRFMRRHLISNQKKSLREAIDSVRCQKDGGNK